MKNLKPSVTQGTLCAIGRVATLLAFACILAAPAAATDIANTPINSASTGTAKPNVMLLMDTSKSILFTHAPNALEGSSTPPPAPQSIGYRASQCNPIYYNPLTTYQMPVDSTGTPLPAPVFSAAPYNYYSPTVVSSPGIHTLVNLNSQFQAFDQNTRARNALDANDEEQRAYYYVYVPTTGAVPTTLPYASAPCTDAYGTPGTNAIPQANDPANTFGTTATTGGVWKRVLVGPVGTPGVTVDETQNFAIWYTYYRTRVALTKSDIGLAFSSLTDGLRVGLINGNPLTKSGPDAQPSAGAAVDPASYQALDDFTPAQKALWYSKLYSQVPGGSSPMREGLARVGRHYAGKTDSINNGMALQFKGAGDTSSCRQNYTIMTTGGYWSQYAETAGPVRMDGTTRVGNQDGTLDAVDPNPSPWGNVDISPRPIYDGGTSGTLTTTDNWNNYSAASCDTGQVNQSTTQNRASTTQITQSTSQPTSWTSQITQSTSQISVNTSQVTQSTSQLQQSSSQMQSNTVAVTKSTSQINQTTTQITTAPVLITTWTTQQNIATSNITKSTSQTKITTTQIRQSTAQATQSTAAITKNTSQWNQSTSQLQISTLQQKASTTQVSISTTQTQQSTAQSTMSTSQIWATNSQNSTPVASCPTSGGYTCTTVTTGPTQVVPGTCVAQAASAGNSYTATTCVNTNTGPTAVASCTPQTASSANGYLQITCTPNNTGPTFTASCTPTSPTSGNGYTTTTCATTTTGPTPVASCTSAAASSANNYTATACTNVTTGPTGAASCTAAAASSANNYTATTCNTAVTGPTPVATCTASGSTTVSPYLVTTCNQVTTGPTPVASCTAASPTSGNSYTTTTCSTASTGPTPVASCTPVAASSSNGYVSTTCGNNTTGPTGVASCTPITATAGNNWMATTCATVTNGPTATGSCTAATASAGNSWTGTTCTTTTTGPTGVASCTAATASSGNSWTTTTCATTTTGPTPTGSCTASGATSGNGWVATTCPVVTSATTTVPSCTAVAASAGNNWTATHCGTTNGTFVGAPSCTPSPTVACNTIVTGPTPVASCTPVAASAGNNWVATTCNTVTTGPTPVASCTAAAAKSGNSWTTTTCNTATSALSYVPSCTAASANSGNGYVATVCTPTVVAAFGVNTCVAQSPSAGNNYLTVNCNTVTTGPTGVPSCTPVTAASGNQWKTTNCNTVTTGPSFTDTCTAAAAASGNQYTTTSCNTATTGPTPVASCTPISANSGNSYVSTTCGTLTTPPTGVASCTPAAANAGNSYTATLCNTATSGPTLVPACTPAAAAAGNGFTTTTCNIANFGPTGVETCTPAAVPNSSNNYTVTVCDVATTGPAQVASASCVPADASFSNNYTTTTCDAVPGEKVQYQTTTTVTTQLLSGGSTVGSPTVSTTTGSVTDLDGVCYSAAQQPALFFTAPPFTATGRPPAVPTTVPNPTHVTSVAPAPTAPCAAWPCAATTNQASGGSDNSLADVAQYYYINDLRPDLADNVFVGAGTGPEDDRVKWQHMTTFVAGLGVSGTLNYSPTYKSDNSGDFSGIRSGAVNWPIWPTPSTTTEAMFNDPRSIDDFWHSAVDGRGQFFSAQNASDLANGIQQALNSIAAATGTGAGATMATSTPTPGNNAVYETSFTSSQWTGNVVALNFTGSGVTTTANWSAQANLDALVNAKCDNRDIKLIRIGAPSNNLVDFTWNSNACDASGNPTVPLGTGLNATEQNYFNAPWAFNGTNPISQFAASGTGSAAQKLAAAGANLVNYLRGQKQYENYVTGNVNQLYRTRAHALGDIADSQLAYVPAPNQAYTDSGYAGFVAANTARSPMAYVGANDGMLHAFYAPLDPTVATAGSELWAVIPSTVLPNLYALADVNYGMKHQFYVNGSPVAGDIYSTASGQWKTILVGGLNAGGRGFYALDISTPGTPKALWQFTTANDANLGLSFGRPVITKMLDGTWVVLLTSGYNNTSPGDGQGYLYVLNADTGALIKKIGTGVGDTGTSTGPSGLRELTVYGSNLAQNNTAVEVYGGDLLGNVWRFDINNATSNSGVLLTTLTDPNGAPQSITTHVSLAEVNGSMIVMVGTGRLLGFSDSVTTQQQTVYGFKDPMTTPTATIPPTAVINPSTLRASLKPVAYTTTGTLAAGTLKRTVAPCAGTAAQCSSTAGWYWDLNQGLSDPLLGSERVSIDMSLAGRTLVFTSSIPSSAQCASGYNLFNELDFTTGAAVAANGVITKDPGGVLPTGQVVVVGPTGPELVTTLADGTNIVSPIDGPVPPPIGKRISWREIVQ